MDVNVYFGCYCSSGRLYVLIYCFFVFKSCYLILNFYSMNIYSFVMIVEY